MLEERLPGEFEHPAAVLRNLADCDALTIDTLVLLDN